MLIRASAGTFTKLAEFLEIHGMKYNFVKYQKNQNRQINILTKFGQISDRFDQVMDDILILAVVHRDIKPKNIKISKI